VHSAVCTLSEDQMRNSTNQQPRSDDAARGKPRKPALNAQIKHNYSNTKKMHSSANLRQRPVYPQHIAAAHSRAVDMRRNCVKYNKRLKIKGKG
jgi:hypothetical protein